MTQHSRTSTTIGRSDLVAAIATGQQNTIAAVVSMLGLELTAPKSLPVADHEPAPSLPSAPQETVSFDSTGYPRNIEPIRFWQCIGYRELAALEIPDPGDIRSEWRVGEESSAATHQLLADWNEIAPRLRRCLSDVRWSQQPNVSRLVTSIARRELIVEIPRETKRRWGAEVHVVTDTSIRLTAFAPDHEEVVRRLHRILPRAKVSVAQGATPSALWYRTDVNPLGDADHRPFTTPSAGSTILVLGDLGCLSRDSNFWRQWYYWGQEQRRHGNHLMALVPCGVKRIAPALHDLFSVESWQSERLAVDDPALRDDLVEQLLVLASPAIRLEPGLLRDLRFLLPNASDGSLEVDVWNSPLMAGCHPDAATIDRDIARKQLLPKFDRLPKELRQDALNCLRRWRLRSRHHPEVWFEEILSLSPESKRLVRPQDLDDARSFTRYLDVERKSKSERRERVEVWMINATNRLTDHAYEDPDVGWLLRETRRELHKEPNAVLAGTDLRELPPGTLFRSRIDIDDKRLTVTNPQTSSQATTVISPSAWLNGSVPLIEISTFAPLRGDAFWKTSQPDFVSAYGTDQYGAWFEFSIPRQDSQVVTQRMRWIRAGSFLMGSPEGESERFSDEAPQHEVTLSRGFWLAETACPQELWEAVSGKNPSRFKGDLRPVEHVSYDEVTQFLDRLAELVPGLSPALPREAQWEFACRAGTTTPFSFGETITTEQANFNGAKNAFPKVAIHNETVDVKALPPNPWGLFQMHGNVWEWCSDWKVKYSSESQTDPPGPEQGSLRVVRGGAWDSLARSVRSACRNWVHPGNHYDFLGFRLLSSALAEPTEAAAVTVADRGQKQTRSGGVNDFFSRKTVAVDFESQTQVELGGCGLIQLRSNLEEIRFVQTDKPPWAVAYGRDSFGIYADFEIPFTDSKPVRQRLRWISPGRFSMGSPETEPGRYDNETLHTVTISAGFWMFDTPCSQMLWEAIVPRMSRSRFRDLDRPVESVDWQESMDFADMLGKLLGLNFTLPTEAQWEYACRAGTSTAIYTGSLKIFGDGNAPSLDPIAWYGGNCGRDYDLDTGGDVSKLKNKQYKFKQGGTRRLQEKVPNPWGLYDMLGNVWEWCRDWHADYPSRPQIDPKCPEGSDRVIRGGSWNSDARYVRSACRRWYRPSHRGDNLGFRLLSSASPVPSFPPNK